jgi:hypothetical protein
MVVLSLVGFVFPIIARNTRKSLDFGVAFQADLRISFDQLAHSSKESAFHGA